LIRITTSLSTIKQLSNVPMFLLKSDIDGLNRRNEPQKISMSKKAEAFEIISQKNCLKCIGAFSAINSKV